MREEPVRQFFSIGDVCTLTDLKPHVLRYWETQFKFLSPAKNRSGNRVYQRREVELILLVKHLLYTEKYTIEGARRKVDEHRKAGGDRVRCRASRSSARRWKPWSASSRLIVDVAAAAPAPRARDRANAEAAPLSVAGEVGVRDPRVRRRHDARRRRRAASARRRARTSA